MRFLAILVAFFIVTSGFSKTRRYIYTVIPGDTFWSISQEFKVPVKSIIRWNKNKFKKKKILRPGMKLVIYSSVFLRKKRKFQYVVKRGDSLYKIAKKVGVSVNHLKAVNYLRRKKVLKPGQVLTYYKRAPKIPSEAIGHPANGRLKHGEKMPKGYGYYIKQPYESYGTNEVIDYLLSCISKFHKKFKKAGNILIGDLSRKHGGKFPPHLSHQNGLDVDIGYFYKKKVQPKRFIVATKKNLDVEKTWFFINCLLKTKKVKFIFMDAYIQKIFYNYLLKKYGKKRIRKYRKLFEITSGKAKGTIFRTSKGHNNHFHVRFLCPKKDKRCVN